jgi:hypothetical protein
MDESLGMDDPEEPEESSKRQCSLYKCPYGSKRCGENATYCARCNQDYEKFLRLIGNEHW